MPANLRVLDAVIERDDENRIPTFTLGDRLRKALDVSGLTAQDMAEVQDVTPSTISRWLRDRSPIRRSHLTLWAIATGVNLAWLETGTAGLENQTGRDQYAIRDSNPEPAGSESRGSVAVLRSVKRGLTPEPRTAARWLRAVV